MTAAARSANQNTSAILPSFQNMSHRTTSHMSKGEPVLVGLAAPQSSHGVTFSGGGVQFIPTEPHGEQMADRGTAKEVTPPWKPNFFK